jgi:hypothetical protein
MSSPIHPARFVQFAAVTKRDSTIVLVVLDAAGQLWWRTLHGEAWVPVGARGRVTVPALLWHNGAVDVVAGVGEHPRLPAVFDVSTTGSRHRRALPTFAVPASTLNEGEGGE